MIEHVVYASIVKRIYFKFMMNLNRILPMSLVNILARWENNIIEFINRFSRGKSLGSITLGNVFNFLNVIPELSNFLKRKTDKKLCQFAMVLLFSDFSLVVLWIPLQLHSNHRFMFRWAKQMHYQNGFVPIVGRKPNSFINSIVQCSMLRTTIWPESSNVKWLLIHWMCLMLYRIQRIKH